MHKDINKAFKEISKKLLDNAGVTSPMPCIFGMSTIDIMTKFLESKGRTYTIVDIEGGIKYIPEAHALFVP